MAKHTIDGIVFTQRGDEWHCRYGVISEVKLSPGKRYTVKEPLVARYCGNKALMFHDFANAARHLIHRIPRN